MIAQGLQTLIRRLKYPFCLFLFLAVAYLPVASFLFALKNDAFIYNFPNKNFFSQTLQSGIIPFWNPYLNAGFPLYADPGFAWWHPVTWLFGFLGYNAYSFTTEILLYIYIAGLGMYKLCSGNGLSRKTAFICACMFMCSGFFVGNLQHINFITCAAFLPWLVASWLQMQCKPSVKNLSFATISLYLLCAGGHPAIPMGTIYFFALFAGFYFIFVKPKHRFKKLLLWNGVFLLASAILLMPLLFSWHQLLPFYTRSIRPVQSHETQLGFTFQSYLSFINPVFTAAKTSFFGTDVSMRNGYISLLGASLFACTLFRPKSGLQKALLASGTIMLLLALGGIIKAVLYSALPLLQYIRGNGEFRVFALFAFITAASFPLDLLLNGDKKAMLFSNRFFKLTLLISVLFFVVVVSLNFQEFEFPKQGSVALFIQQLSFIQIMLMGSLACIITSALYLFLINGISNRIAIILMADLIANTWLLLPITGVGKTSVAQMQLVYNKAPKTSTVKNSLPQDSAFLTVAEEQLVGDWAWYDKQLVKKKMIDYPSALRSAERIVMGKETSFCYLQSNRPTQLTFLSPNRFSVTVDANDSDTLLIRQNFYPAWQAFITGKRLPVLSHKDGRLAVAVPQGKHVVDLYFRPFQN